MEFSLSRCANPKCKRAPHSYVYLLSNKLSLAIRRHIQLYYAVRDPDWLCHFYIIISNFLSHFRVGLFVKIGAVVLGHVGCPSKAHALIQYVSVAVTVIWI